MKLVLYNNITNKVIGFTGGEQQLDIYLEACPEEEKLRTSGIYLEHVPQDYYNYKIENDKMVRLPELDIMELQRYGKIFSTEERMLEKLKPSQEEIQKAKQTIQVLSLLQEVIANE